MLLITTFTSVAGTIYNNKNIDERRDIIITSNPNLNYKNILYADGQKTGELIRIQQSDICPMKISKNTRLDEGAIIKVPLDKTVKRPSDLLEIQGDAFDANFQNYILEWGDGNEPSEWFTDGIILINDGLLEILNNTLGTWNTSSITIVGEYTIRLTVNCGSTQKSDSVVIYLDPTLKEGWPQYYPNVGATAAADINNDGKLEISAFIEHQHGLQVAIAAWEHNGSICAGFPIHLPGIGGGGAVPPVALGDVNNDGELEIVTGYAWNSQEIYVIKNDGTILDGWPQNASASPPTSGFAVLADIDDDEFLEIFVGGDKLNAWHYNGIPVEGFPKNFPCTSPAIGDINDDGEFEIITLRPDVNKLFVFDASGNELLNVNLESIASNGAPPVIGDINHDGSKEMLFSLGNGKVYAYSKEGEIVKTWSFDSSEIANSPVLADIDGDNNLEIFMSTFVFTVYGKIYGWDHEGNNLPGWPKFLTHFYRVSGSPVIGNVDEDDEMEIVLGGECPQSFYEEIYAWKANGAVVDGWPKYVTPVEGYGIMSSPLIIDIDDDGHSEVIVSSNSYIYSGQDGRPRTAVYIWNLPGTYAFEWPMYQCNAQHTGLHHENDYNQPPSTPTITGPAKAKIKINIAYNFTTMDIDGDDVFYFIDWGDQTNSSWIGPYSSGEIITRSHSWFKKGTYSIKAKAKDIYGKESDWGTLEITMPFSYAIPIHPFLDRLFERFPHAFPILRHLMGY
jgi:hypothetical protein